MEKLIVKFLRTFIKIKNKQVYCLETNRYVEAYYCYCFGVYVGVSYMDVK